MGKRTKTAAMENLKTAPAINSRQTKYTSIKNKYIDT